MGGARQPVAPLLSARTAEGLHTREGKERACTRDEQTSLGVLLCVWDARLRRATAQLSFCTQKPAERCLTRCLTNLKAFLSPTSVLWQCCWWHIAARTLQLTHMSVSLNEQARNQKECKLVHEKREEQSRAHASNGGADGAKAGATRSGDLM